MPYDPDDNPFARSLAEYDPTADMALIGGYFGQAAPFGAEDGAPGGAPGVPDAAGVRLSSETWAQKVSQYDATADQKTIEEYFGKGAQQLAGGVAGGGPDTRTNIERDYPHGVSHLSLEELAARHPERQYATETPAQEATRLTQEYARGQAAAGPGTVANVASYAPGMLAAQALGVGGTPEVIQRDLETPWERAGLKFYGPALRPFVGDEAQRQAKVLGLASDMQGGGEFARQFRGVVGSGAQMAGNLGLAHLTHTGFAGVAVLNGLQQADESFTEARDAGLNDAQALRHAAIMGGIETGVMLLFNKLGPTGEKFLLGTLKGKLASGGFRGAMAEFFKAVVGENAEELATNFAQKAAEKLDGVDRREWTWDETRDLLKDTTIQTTATMGILGGGKIGTLAYKQATDADFVRQLEQQHAAKREAAEQTQIGQLPGDLIRGQLEGEQSRMADEQQAQAELTARARQFVAGYSPDVIENLAGLTEPTRAQFAEAAGIDDSQAPRPGAVREAIIAEARAKLAAPAPPPADVQPAQSSTVEEAAKIGTKERGLFVNPPAQTGQAFTDWQSKSSTREHGWDAGLSPTHRQTIAAAAEAHGVDPAVVRWQAERDYAQATTEWNLKKEIWDHIRLKAKQRGLLESSDVAALEKRGTNIDAMKRELQGMHPELSEQFVEDTLKEKPQPPPRWSREFIDKAASQAADLRGQLEQHAQQQPAKEGDSADEFLPENQPGNVAGVPFRPSSPTGGAANLPALMRQIDPQAARGGLVSARDLRRASGLGKAAFDRLVLEAARQGVVSLHRHDRVAVLTPAEAADLVHQPGAETQGNGLHAPGTYYVGLAIPQGAPPAGGEVFGRPGDKRAQPVESRERTAAGKETTSIQQVVDAAVDLVKKITGRDMTARLGRVKKGAAGQAHMRSGVQRRTSYTDLATLIHEAAHFLWEKIRPKIGTAAHPNVTYELAAIGHDLYRDPANPPAAGYPAEGFSEFMAMWATNPQQAASIAPHTVAWLDAVLAKSDPQVKAAAAQAQKLGTLWYSQGAVNRALQQSVTPADVRGDKWKAAVSNVLSFDWWRKAFSNASHSVTTVPTRLAERKIGRRLAPDESPNYLGDAFSGTNAGIVANMIDGEMFNRARERTGDSLKGELAPLLEMKPERFEQATGQKHGTKMLERLFDVYLKARRTIKLQTAENPRETGMSLDDAQYLAQKFDAELPEFKQAAEGLYRWWDGVMKFVAEHDPLYAKMYENILAKDPGDYVPLQRFFSETEGEYRSMTGAARSRAQWGSLTGRLRGSGRPTKSILPTMANQASKLVQQAFQRNAMENIVDLARTVPDFGRLVEKVDPQQVPELHNMLDAIRSIEKQMQEVDPMASLDVHGLSSKDLAQMSAVFFSDQRSAHGRDALYLRIGKDGNLEAYRVNAETLKGLEGFDSTQVRALSPVGKALDFLFANTARMVKVGAVGPLAPGFTFLKNVFVDFPGYMFNSRAQTNVIEAGANWFRGLYHAIQGKRSPWVRLYRKLGLERIGIFGENTRTAEVAIRDILERPAEKLLDPGVAWDKYVGAAQVTETVSRLAELIGVAESIGVKDPTQALTVSEVNQLTSAAKNVTGDYTSKGTWTGPLARYIPFADVFLVHGRSAVGAAAHAGSELRASLKEGRLPDKRATRAAMVALGLTAAALAHWLRVRDEEWWKEQTDQERANWLRLSKDGWRLPINSELGQVAVALPIAMADAIHNGSSQPMKEWLANFIQELSPISRQKLPPLLKLALEQSGLSTAPGGGVVPEYLARRPAVEQVKPNTSKTAEAIGRARGLSPVRIEHAADTLTGGAFSRIAKTAEQPFRERQSEASDLPLVGQFIDRDATTRSTNEFYERLNELETQQQSREHPETPEQAVRRKQMADASRAMAELRKLYREATSTEDIQSIRQRIQSIAKEALEADRNGTVDRSRFRGLRQAAEYLAEPDADKRAKMLQDRLSPLSRSEPMIGHRGVTMDNLDAKRAAYEEDVETAETFVKEAGLTPAEAQAEFRPAQVGRARPAGGMRIGGGGGGAAPMPRMHSGGSARGRAVGGQRAAAVPSAPAESSAGPALRVRTQSAMHAAPRLGKIGSQSRGIRAATAPQLRMPRMQGASLPSIRGQGAPRIGRRGITHRRHLQRFGG